MYSPAATWRGRSRDMRSIATTSPTTAPSAIAAMVTTTVILIPAKRYGRFVVTTRTFQFTRASTPRGDVGWLRTRR